LKDTEAAYLAGFIEGDGCISVYPLKRKTKTYYGKSITFTTTSNDLIEFIKNILNQDNIHFRTRIGNYNIKWKTKYDIIIEKSSDIIKLVNYIQPFLTSKQGIAMNIINSINNINPYENYLEVTSKNKRGNDLIIQVPLMDKKWYTELKEINETSKAYVAGLFDAEGSVGLCNNSNEGICPYLTIVSNTNKEIVESVKNIINLLTELEINLRRKSNPKHKALYDIRTRKRIEIIKILQVIQPYIIIKKTRVLTTLEFLIKLSDLNKYYYNLLNNLNKKGK